MTKNSSIPARRIRLCVQLSAAFVFAVSIMHTELEGSAFQKRLFAAVKSAAHFPLFIYMTASLFLGVR